jgi:hypothetical protein
VLFASPGGALRGGAAASRGPFDILLFSTPAAPHATAKARLTYVTSPFGIAVTEDGRASYNVEMSIAGLPDPTTLGHFATYVAWASNPDLTEWIRLGTVTNGQNTVGPVSLNKFLVVLSAEPANSTATSPTGPTVLHGTSPSGYIQSFLSHPLFRNVPQ